MNTRQNKLYYLVFALAAVILAAAIFLLVFNRDDGKEYHELFAQAQEDYSRGDYDAAAEELEQAIALQQTAEAYTLLAQCHHARGDLDVAINVLYLGYSKTGEDAVARLLETYKTEKNGPASDPNVSEEKVQLAGGEYALSERALVLADKNLSAEDLATLSRFSQLESLSLSNNQLSDISFLSSLSELTFLQISGNQITDLTPLRSLTRLKNLYIDDNPITDFTPLYALTNLKTLSMKDITVTISRLQELQDALPNCSVYAEKPIAEVTQLSIGDRNFASDITELTLDGVTVPDVSVLAKCTALTKLSAKSCGLSDISLLVDLQQLGILDIAGNSVSDLRPLMSLSQLRELNASGNGIEDIAVMRYLPSLVVLNLDGNPIERFDAIGSLGSLVSLSLRNCAVTDEHLEIFAGLSKLRYLELEGNLDLTANAVDELRKALPGCTINTSELLYTVEFGGNRYTSDVSSITALSAGVFDLSGLEHFSALTELVLPNNAISSLEPLKDLMTLEKLDLYSNAISDLSPLTGHTALKILDLDNNQLDDLTPLSSCTGLKEVHLNNNQISDLRALSSCENLRELELRDNNISDLSPLSGLSNLRTLDLDNNAVEDLTPLYDLSSLRILYLRGNDINHADLIQLQNALPDCRILADSTVDNFREEDARDRDEEDDPLLP